MKVNKETQVKGNAKSLKWKDVRGKRCRAPVSSSDLNSSPVMVKVIKEHQASVKKKPKVKRLKSKAKSVSDSKKSTPQPGLKKSKTQANGGPAFTMDCESEDLQGWREYSQSIQANGVKKTSNKGKPHSGRLEEMSLHHCAERDDQGNHAVLVMQKDEVCFCSTGQQLSHHECPFF